MMNGINLSLVSHYINCDNCQNQLHCDIAHMLITSISSEGLASAETITLQSQTNERISRSNPELIRRDISLISESMRTNMDDDGGAAVFDSSIDAEPEKSNNQSS